jgi:hypothetical protein
VTEPIGPVARPMAFWLRREVQSCLNAAGSLAEPSLGRGDTLEMRSAIRAVAEEATDGEHQIPSHHPQDHLSGELPTLERLIPPQLSRLSPFRHGAAYTWPRSRRKAATEPDLERGACRMINAEGISPTDLKPEICIRAFQRKFSA